MGIEIKILGLPGRDNAVLVRLDSGQSVVRLLFDCGAGCVDSLACSEVAEIDHLFFSHLHMDHVCGFDDFFRLTYARATKPIHVWGPGGTIEALHHRFRGFAWNLVSGSAGTWRVSEVDGLHVRTARFQTCEAFAHAHPEASRPFSGILLDDPRFTVAGCLLDHGIPSLGCAVRERPRQNIDGDELGRLGLQPGPWLHSVKAIAVPEEEELEIEGRRFRVGELRRRLVRTTRGDSVAYLTDFRLVGEAPAELLATLEGCGTLICESQYLSEHGDLARANFHMTAAGAAALARRSGVGRLVLFHLSDRYAPEDRPRFLAEARAVFPNTHFPQEWQGAWQTGPTL